MADYYGSYYTGNWGYQTFRAWERVTITSNTATQAVIQVVGYIQMGPSFSSTIADDWTSRATINGNATTRNFSNGSRGNGSDPSYAMGQSYVMQTKTLTINKTHAAQSINCQHYVKSNWMWTDANSTASGNISVSAKTSYTVAYNANGGSGAPGSQTKWHGETLTLSSTVPTRAGYRFDGWATSSTGAVAYRAGGSYTANSGVTLYAHWTSLYLVEYSANGGTGTTASHYKTPGTPLTLRQNGFTRAGFAFRRWSTEPDDTGTPYDEGATYSTDASLTLHAIWERTISYDLNGAEGDPPDAQTEVATTAIGLAPAPERDGFSFLGWCESADGGGQIYAAGSEYPAGRGSAMLHALWSRTIVYDANGGSQAPQGQTGLATEALVVSSPLARPGWRFAGWNEQADGTGEGWQPGDPYASQLPDVTLYAIWERWLDSLLVSGSGGVRTDTATGLEESDDGTYAYVWVDWLLSGAAAASLNVTARCLDSTGASHPCQVATYASVAKSMGDEALSGRTIVRATDVSADLSYAFTVSLTAANESAAQEDLTASATIPISVAYFPLDVRAGGHGISFGAPSRGDWHNTAMPEKYYENPDMPVVTYSSKAVAQAALDANPDMLPCIVLCMDDFSLWHCKAE